MQYIHVTTCSLGSSIMCHMLGEKKKPESYYHNKIHSFTFSLNVEIFGNITWNIVSPT